MAAKIEWNKKALEKLHNLIFNFKEHRPSYPDKFIKKIYEKLGQIEQFPEIGMPSKKKKTVRSVKIDARHRMYYRTKGKTIIVVYFFDSKQHPDKNPY